MDWVFVRGRALVFLDNGYAELGAVFLRNRNGVWHLKEEDPSPWGESGSYRRVETRTVLPYAGGIGYVYWMGDDVFLRRPTAENATTEQLSRPVSWMVNKVKPQKAFKPVQLLLRGMDDC
jgi:hypothetical protein